MNLAASLHHYGYAFIFAVLFVESLGIPAPSELTLVTAGVLAGQGEIQPLLAIAAGALGSTVGALISYTIGWRGGRRLLLRYGRRVGLTEERLRRVERFFERWGAWAVVVGRVVSGVRAVISYPAGFFRMPLARFLIATVVGAILWPVMAVEFGQVLGRHWNVLWDLAVDNGPLIGVGVLVLLVAAWVWRRLRKRREHARL